MTPSALHKPTVLDLAVIIGLAAVWGSVFPAIKITVNETGPLWLVAGRTALAAAVLLPWVFWRGLTLPNIHQHWKLIVAIAALNVAAPFSLIAWAQQSVDASVTAVLLGAGPFFALLISHFTSADDRLSPLKAIAMAIGFSGVVLIFAKDLTLDTSAPWQKLAILLASLCYVVSGALSRRVSDVPPTRLAFLVFAINAAVFIPLALTLQDVPATLSSSAIWSLVYVGLIPTGLATILRYHMIRRVGLTFYAQGMNFIPVFGVALGVLLVDEAITLGLVTGLILIMAGLLLARRAGKAGGATESGRPSAD